MTSAWGQHYCCPSLQTSCGCYFLKHYTIYTNIRNKNNWKVQQITILYQLNVRFVIFQSVSGPFLLVSVRSCPFRSVPDITWTAKYVKLKWYGSETLRIWDIMNMYDEGRGLLMVRDPHLRGIDCRLAFITPTRSKYICIINVIINFIIVINLM